MGAVYIVALFVARVYTDIYRMIIRYGGVQCYRLLRLDYKAWFEELDFDVAIQSVEALIADGYLDNLNYRDQIKLKAFVILAKKHKKNLESGLVNQRVEIPLENIESLLTISQEPTNK